MSQWHKKQIEAEQRRARVKAELEKKYAYNKDFGSEYEPAIAKFLKMQLEKAILEKCPGGLVYGDNRRHAKKSDPASVERYNYWANKGCCGIKDFEVTAPDGEVYMIGFNYGH